MFWSPAPCSKSGSNLKGFKNYKNGVSTRILPAASWPLPEQICSNHLGATRKCRFWPSNKRCKKCRLRTDRLAVYRTARWKRERISVGFPPRAGSGGFSDRQPKHVWTKPPVWAIIRWKVLEPGPTSVSATLLLLAEASKPPDEAEDFSGAQRATCGPPLARSSALPHLVCLLSRSADRMTTSNADEDIITALGWTASNELYTCSDDKTICKWNMNGEPLGKVMQLDVYVTDFQWFPAKQAGQGTKASSDVFVVGCVDGARFLIVMPEQLKR